MYTLIIKQGVSVSMARLSTFLLKMEIEAAGPELANNQQAEKVIDLQGKLMSVLVD